MGKITDTTGRYKHWWVMDETIKINKKTLDRTLTNGSSVRLFTPFGNKRTRYLKLITKIQTRD